VQEVDERAGLVLKALVLARVVAVDVRSSSNGTCCTASLRAPAAIIGAVKTIEAVATTSGSPAAVWALLADAPTWARWGSWSKVEVEGGGAQGPGAVRLLVRAPYRVRERITEWVPGERLGYELLDGMRVRAYRSAVTLEQAHHGGTVVRWRSTYEHAGPLTALVLRLAVRDSCRRLAKAAADDER
jgi:uncharacterized protein YndB with AHSA1/START domain